MTTPTRDDETPYMTPEAGIARTAADSDLGSGRPPGKHSTDVPPSPGEPMPYPENPDLPGSPPEPGEPGQGQPIPPELDTTEPRL